MRTLLPHMPTMLESAAPATRDTRLRTSNAAPVAARVPATDSTDLVSRDRDLTRRPTWHARRRESLARTAW
jgi:hypothetical protein